MAENEETIELFYDRAGIFKRLSAALFDFFISVVCGFLILMLTFYVVPKFPNVQNDLQVRETISLDSSLYVLNDDLIRLDDYLEETSLTIDEKSEILNDNLLSFFSDEKFVKNGEKEYQTLKEQAYSSDEQRLFDESGVRILVNDDYDEEYYDFYLSSYEIAIGYLFNNIDYSLASRNLLLTYIIAIIITFLIPLLVFYCIIPLFYKRTRQTFGMKLVKIALINVDGLSLKQSKYLGRSTFVFVIEILLSIFAFLLPLAISLGFLVLSKSHQTLADYVFNTYVVDITKDKIYFDLKEYQYAHQQKQHLSIEDKNYQPVIKK